MAQPLDILDAIGNASLVRGARAAVDRWERERLCSRHYIARWRAMLDGPVERVARALLEPGTGQPLEEDRRWVRGTRG